MKKSSKWGLGILAGGIAAYTAILASLYVRQDKIMFQRSLQHPLRHLFLEKFGYRAKEYTLPGLYSLPTLKGWWIDAEKESDTILIYFGGNAENIDSLLFFSSNIPEINMLSMHYRGYGLSEGDPNEHSLFEDAVRIVDKIHEEHPTKKIVLFGRSLGTGIALYAAKERPELIHHIILSTPYDSIAAVAKRHYSWAPIYTLLRNQFNSLAIAPFIKNPVTIIVAGQDTYIPIEHAHQLSLILQEHVNVQWYNVKHADHSNIQDWNETWMHVRKSIGLSPDIKKIEMGADLVGTLVDSRSLSAPLVRESQ